MAYHTRGVGGFEALGLHPCAELLDREVGQGALGGGRGHPVFLNHEWTRINTNVCYFAGGAAPSASAFLAAASRSFFFLFLILFFFFAAASSSGLR